MNGGTLAEEMLAGSGLIKTLETTYIGLEGGMPVAYGIRRCIEQGVIELVETIVTGALLKEPWPESWGYLSCHAWRLGSDILEYDTFKKASLRGEKKMVIYPSGYTTKKYEVIDDPFDGFESRPREGSLQVMTVVVTKQMLMETVR